ncbi:Fic family protein [Prevotella sp. MA2016]|uniref:Fic family protein n=1 Tax=Prevotella sp. MA2016 TaxID=1408310 RepID=UPI00056948E2|nr:Fic family protein [Prevotella sp. MA2016]
MSKQPSYIPPFTVSADAINLIAEISAQIERYAIRLEQEDGLRLRKANRIKTIHSSLAIEGNLLSEDEVRDIVDGKNVVAPIRQIQEVKNAIKTYELYPTLDAFNEKDLLKAHGVMMQALVDDAGHYRKGGVGVFGEKGLVHMAPPAERVPMLMADLFNWLKYSKDHLLIRSCVFHYEFEFIHPFIDGNGRTGRLWQSLILGKLHPLFEHLPVENMVYANQQQYYDAITASSNAGQSGPFIDFMLNEIYKTLKEHQGEALPDKLHDKVPNKLPNKVPNKLRLQYPDLSDAVWDVYQELMEDGHASAATVGSHLGISDRMVRKHISVLRDAGIIERIGGNKTGYWKLLKK